MTITSNVTHRLREMLAARRTLICAATAIALAPAVFATLSAGTAQTLIALALPVLPLVLLMLIAAGVLDAAARDARREQEVGMEFPRPLQLRG